jgi:hypothetical protein
MPHRVNSLFYCYLLVLAQELCQFSELLVVVKIATNLLLNPFTLSIVPSQSMISAVNVGSVKVNLDAFTALAIL